MTAGPLTADPLTPGIRQLFGDLAHAGPAPVQASCGAGTGAGTGVRVVYGEGGRTRRGTEVRFELSVFQGQVVAARYRAYGCPYTLAVCEWICRELEAGRQAAIGTPADWCRRLDIPIVRLGRLLVVEDALNAAKQHMRRNAADGRENVVK